MISKPAPDATAMTRATHLPDGKTLALSVLTAALADIEREARCTGRLELFLAVRPWLGTSASALPTGEGVPDDSVFRLALQRLRQRFRERVNRRLRDIEADPERRRTLRRHLYAACRQIEVSR
jgi:hypothetical protein